MSLIRTILHPTDYSETSQHAFAWAVQLAQQHKAHLLILHVVNSLDPERISYGEAKTKPQPESYQAQLREELRRLTPSDPHVSTEHLLAEGEPAAEILRVAREYHCDLIVLGTHGRTGLDRLLLGSVAEQVIRRAACPVLTVRSPARAA
jgi:nucleotide-binding universal stress UspA family protein